MGTYPINDVVSDKSLKAVLGQLFLECEHGDAEHRQWLKDKFDDYFKRYQEHEKVRKLENSVISS